MVYTCSPEAHAPGMRLKAQVNENGKSPALVVALPEAAHNDIVGWEVLRPRRRDCLLLMLHSDDCSFVFFKQKTAYEITV